MLRLLGFVMLVLLILGGIGYYRGWFDVESNDGKTTLSLDNERAKEDLAKGKEKAGDLLDRIGDAIAAKRLEGEVTKVDAGGRTLRFRPEGQDDSLAVRVPSDDVVKRNGDAAALHDIEIGDHVTVKFVEEDGEAVATEVDARG